MSAIKFDHTQEDFNLAIGIDEEQHQLLQETLAELSKLMFDRIRDDNSMSKSEVAEILANTLSYKELLYLATDAMKVKTDRAIDAFGKFHKLAAERNINPEDQDAIKSLIKEVASNDDDDSSSSIRTIAIDADDIDGSLDRANVPKEIRSQIKLRLLEEMMKRMSKDLKDGDDQ